MLTPLGRGASLLVVGPNSSGKSTLALDAIIGQVGTGVKCILSSTSRNEQQLQELVQVRRLEGGVAVCRLTCARASNASAAAPAGTSSSCMSWCR